MTKPILSEEKQLELVNDILKEIINHQNGEISRLTPSINLQKEYNISDGAFYNYTKIIPKEYLYKLTILKAKL